MGSSSSAAVVATKRRWGFNARLATAVAVLAVIAVVAFMFMHGRPRALVDRTAVNSQPQAAGEAAGDVALHARHVQYPDTSMLTGPSTGATQRVSPPPTPAPITSAPQNVHPTSPIAPPTTRRHEPLHTPPPYVFPSPSAPASADTAANVVVPHRDSSGTSANTAATSDACRSPTAADQHRCLMNAIDRNDVALNSTYHALITALRRQANVASNDPDPDAVTRLRNAQRQWLDVRDQICRSVGTGPLYALDRAQCFADQSAKRTRELQQQADAIPQGT